MSKFVYFKYVQFFAPQIWLEKAAKSKQTKYKGSSLNQRFIGRLEHQVWTTRKNKESLATKSRRKIVKLEQFDKTEIGQGRDSKKNH